MQLYNYVRVTLHSITPLLCLLFFQVKNWVLNERDFEGIMGKCGRDMEMLSACGGNA